MRCAARAIARSSLSRPERTRSSSARNCASVLAISSIVFARSRAQRSTLATTTHRLPSTVTSHAARFRDRHPTCVGCGGRGERGRTGRVAMQPGGEHMFEPARSERRDVVVRDQPAVRHHADLSDPEPCL